VTTARPARDLAATRDKLTAALMATARASTQLVEQLTDALLPVVAEAIADELDAAASELPVVMSTGVQGFKQQIHDLQHLRARAADIREKAGRP
jgi:hypothetical protein